MSWIAEYDTQGREFPTCVHVTKTTGTMTHGVTYVPIEDGKAVRAENAKLRERIDAAHMSRLLTENENESLRELLAGAFEDMVAWQRVIACSNEWGYGRGCREQLFELRDAMRDLGVEVDFDGR